MRCTTGFTTWSSKWSGIAVAVEKVVARAAARQGVSRPDRNPQPIRANPIIETLTAPTTPPPGMIEMRASEIFRLAGVA